MTVGELLLRIAVATTLAGIIGLERELRDQAAGFRTHILVSVGAAAFTLSSIYGLEPFFAGPDTLNVRLDPGRIAAQVVSGIGFLGAGAIIRHGVSVRGLTTAASLWTAAAVGLASGLGLFMLAGVTTAAVVISLYVLRYLENHIIYPRMRNIVDLRVRFTHKGFGPFPRLVERLDQNDVVVRRMSVDAEAPEANIIRITLELPSELTPASVTRLVAEVEGVEEVDQA